MKYKYNKSKIKYKQNNSKYAEIRKSKIGGNGIFSLREVKKGERIMPWGGHIVELNDPLALLYREYAVRWEGKALIPYKLDIPGGYLCNSSCNPNAALSETIKQPFLIAQKDIHIGDEITYCYGIIWFSTRNIKCNCSEQHCISNITNTSSRLDILSYGIDIAIKNKNYMQVEIYKDMLNDC